MLVLGIETSCDETATAVLNISSPGSFKILSECVASQTDVHRAYGGVVPELASREHLTALPLLLEECLAQSQVPLEKIDLIGVTCGPGLKGCLLTGVEFAKGLSIASRVPTVGVNHIEGHVWAPRLIHPELEPPFLALIASGGHSEIQIVKGIGEYELIARTVDDAAGEAFDKSAALMDFPYPGGPALAQMADTFAGKPRFALPKVMREAKGLSFAGLKTAISLLVQREKQSGSFQSSKAEIASAVQNAIVDALLFKVGKALEASRLSTLVVTGGVSANAYLREKAMSLRVPHVLFPAKQHCMDNAAMIAYVAGIRFLICGECGSQKESLEIHPRWPIEHAGEQLV